MLVRCFQTGLPFPAVAGGTRYACTPLDPWDKPEDGGSGTDKPHEHSRHGLPGAWA
jgi:hypothetical protein